MACLEPLFGGRVPIRTQPGRAIHPAAMADVEYLLVRSVTQVNRALIEAAPKLKFVGTATIGTDHLDIPALETRGIHWASAPGCNAEAVGEYLLSALLELALRQGEDLHRRTIGLIGLGNTGSAVARRLEALGLTVLRCDPPRAQAGEPGPWVELDTLLARCDVVSCHVPFTAQTHHLLNRERLAALRPGCWLINASRGEVIDNRALIEVKRARGDLTLVMDVWEGEPAPMPELVALCELATAHIAGYSVEGKIRGTQMLHRALACTPVALPGMGETPSLAALMSAEPRPEVTLAGRPTQSELHQLCQGVYDLAEEDRRFRTALTQPGGFDARRKANLARREFSAQPVHTQDTGAAKMMAALGFKIRE
ncbi:4-phosphoerythronate dehydrogenase [Ferrimonas balearica]|uniref:4-phosphoerythronate dehydrogenase n=1 Tax=Ferrimonas balearica TaxID=44012 RepID=UPI001C99F5F9|nr:4-phosphoerythronate dehydrogenase [Ferrimonas balearica]MBY5993764.1 4-phosphoerythronate dehydrogenase [Ferrimonas balearica]